MFSDKKLNKIKTELEFSDSFSDSIKIENEDVNEEESFMEQSLPQFSYTLDLSFHHNTPEEVSCEMKPTLEYLKLNGDNSVVTNSDSPWDLASKTFPRSLERILNNCGVRKAKNTKNVITPDMNIKKKALVDNKNVNMINDGKTNKLKDKYISETVNQFAKEITSESDVLKKYKEKTKPLTDIEILQNKYGNSENDKKKNAGCLTEESVQEDESEKQMINKRKREKLEGISIFDTPKVQRCQKKKRSQHLQGSFSSDNSELDLLVQNGPTIYSKNKNKYEQSEDIISDSQKNEFIPSIQENESHIGKIKWKKNKKLVEKITDKVSNKSVHIDKEDENLTEKSERNSKHELSGDSMISVDKNTFVDLVEHEEYLTKKNKRKKHREIKDNEKHKQHEENIPSVNKNQLVQCNEVSDSHTQKNKKKKHKEQEEKLVHIDKNQFVPLVKKNENLEEKSNKKHKDEQFGNGVLCIDNDQVVYLEYDKNLSKKSKRMKCTQYEETIPYVDTDGLIQLNKEGGSYAGEKKKKKQKEVEEKFDYIDKNQIVHLDEENENLTEKSNKNHDQAGDDEIEYVHFAEENLAKKPKRKKGRQLEENEIVMEKGITVKEHKQPAQSISYVDGNEFFQSNEGDTYTRKNKRKKHKQLKEKIGYIDNNQFVHLAEENENLTEKRKSNKENKLEQSGYGISCIDNNELTNLDEESEYFMKKTKKKKYGQLEENEIVMEKCQKKRQNKPIESVSYVSENESVQLNEKSKFHVGESKNKKHMELQETITHVDNNQFFHLGEENENLTTKMEKDKYAQLEHNISSIDDSKFFDLVESVTRLSQKMPGQFEENDYLLPTIDSNEFIDLGEVNESLDEKNKKEQHKKLEQEISNFDNNELLHLNRENESIKHKTKKKTRCKPLEESISDNDKSELMELIGDNILDTNIFSSISEKEKRSKSKISDKSKKKLDNINIVKDLMIDDEEDIFSGIFKSESSRETIIQNVDSENTPPLLKKNNNSSRNRSNKEKGDSVVMKEELSNNLADNVVRRNMKNSPQDVPKAESYTFSDILSQTHSDKLKQKFNDIVNKSIEEKSSDASPKSSKHVSKSQLKQRSMHDFVKPKIDLEEHQKKLKIIDLLNESKTIEDIREELEMPIITEQRKQVEGLVIETDWPIAPIHRIAYFVNSCPTAGQKRALESAGITWKLGKYTKEEDEKIIQNWANFCKVHNWNEENYQPFLKCSTKTTIGILNQLQRRKFAHYISRGFENRLLYSVYHRFQRMFLENEANSGRFTEEDDRIIEEYVNSGNSSQPFADLVDLLKRSRLALIKRYKFIEMKDKRKDERVLWNKELTEKLLANLIEVTRSVKLSELKNYNITVREWKKVSKLMNIPAYKLKRAWKFSLYPRFFSQNYVTELTEVKKELVDLLYIKYNDWREVNWEEVAEQLGNKFSGPKLCKVMRDLIISKVPPKKRDSLHHAMKYLRLHYQNWGVTKNRFKFVEDILEETRNVTIIPKIVNKSAKEEKSPVKCGSTSKKRTK